MPPPSKRRRTEPVVEEVVFDPAARQSYLTGFRKRKQLRIKHAQDEAARKERAFKIEQRKELREKRQREAENHVKMVNSMLKNAEGDSDADSSGNSIEDADGVAHELAKEDSQTRAENRQDEYVDEEKYTTVEVGPINLSDGEGDSGENGFEQSGSPPNVVAEDDHEKLRSVAEETKGKRAWTKEKPGDSKPKKRRKKFRYETKLERRAEKVKQRAKNSAAARARRRAN